MLADLWRRQPIDNPFGTATTGSSEAVMLAGLAMKRACQERNACFDRRLNVVVGSNAHACVFKFAAYFELETRVVPVTAGSNYVFDAGELEGKLDRDTGTIALCLRTSTVLISSCSWCLPYSGKYLHRPLRSSPGSV